MKSVGALQTMLAWEEDTALLRSTPGRPRGQDRRQSRAYLGSAFSRRSHHDSSGIGTNATNLRGTMPRQPGHDAVHHSITPIGRNSISR